MITTKLRDRTLELLKNRPAWLKYPQIAEETGIPLGWIKVFAQEQSEGPDVNRVETLYEYLANKSIDV